MHWLLFLSWAAIAEVISCAAPWGLDAVTDDIYCGKLPEFCTESKYRSFDGSCNNLEKSWYGTPLTPYWRAVTCNSNANSVPPIYNQDLPNPRTVSLQFFVDLKVKDPRWTLLFMQYGQIIAHDLSLTAGVTQTKRNAITCCTDDGQWTKEEDTNPRCASIPIPYNDLYNVPAGRECMNFVRVKTTSDYQNCTNASDVPEPLNAVTAWMDASFMYGVNDEAASKVREFRGGRLAYVIRKGKMLLPQDPHPKQACDVDSPSEPCYFSGDERVNQNPELALLQNIYLQHHNYVAYQLSQVNPHWDDETLFQETRRIVIAMHQHIIYYEFLPELIGQEFMAENEIYYPEAEGFINDYNPFVNPGVSNEFACAFRLYHSEIVGSLRAMNENRTTNNLIQLAEWWNKPSVCEYANNFDGLTRGLATQAQSAVDQYLTTDITNQLFKKGNLGSDLTAIDVQRGRDQWVCTYATYLRHFGLLDPQDFDGFTNFIKPQNVDLLADLYKSHEDVDQGVALRIEELLPGTLVGAVAQRVIAEQFYRSRVADACFYENGNGKCAFTFDQLQEIRRSSTIASILCLNRDIERMQPKAFRQISKKNSLKSCRQLPRFNPLPWKE